MGKGDMIGLQQPASKTSPEESGGENEVQKLETELEIRAQVKEYLQKRGYQVTEQARITGKSAIEHVFDMLAERDDGIINHATVVSFTAGGEREEEVATIFNFANKAYDTGIQDRILVAIPGLSQEATKLAQKQRIKVIDDDKLKTLLNLTPDLQVQTAGSISFDTKDQLMQALMERGYRVEEDAKVQGRSGVEYSFDILAYIDMDGVGHSLGIDFLSAEKEVNLEQVSLFDTKAYSVGIDDKAIVVSPALSTEAKQFAQHQRIRVFESQAAKAKETPAGEQAPSQPVEKPAEPATAKPRARQLHQMVQPEVLQLIPEVMARRYNAMPLTISGKTLQVAMANPSDIFALEAFTALSKKRIQPIAASAKEVRDAIDFSYKSHGEIEKQIAHISIPDDALDERLAIDAAIDAPLAQALNLIIEEAVKARASDIHIEPEEDRVRVRYRIDGTLQDMMSLPANIHRAIISRIKILSDLNIADHHRPQDGQFSSEVKGRAIDIRVATSPTVSGEMSVLRILDKSRATLGLAELGFLPESREKYENMLKTPYGMILISGPTGAGKTTTLYASINSLDTLGRNIITIEDPAEYRFKDINQIQVNPQAGITFARGLRSILRLDPDVILVGEIRDTETTNIAIQSALTGHLMLTSVHASDAAGVLTRLIDLGVETFLIASSVIGIVAQRMVRRVCPDCSHPIEAPKTEQLAYERETGEKKKEFLYGTGCASCAYTGYLGRTGIFEILTMSDQLRTLVCERANSSAIRAQALKEGMATMRNDGMLKVKAGITTPAEVIRSAYSTE
jgi:general secretion pathway protein E